jgi:hypothetical protein
MRIQLGCWGGQSHWLWVVDFAKSQVQARAVVLPKLRAIAVQLLMSCPCKSMPPPPAGVWGCWVGAQRRRRHSFHVHTQVPPRSKQEVAQCRKVMRTELHFQRCPCKRYYL